MGGGAPLGQLLWYFGVHHAGRGLHPAGAFGARARAAVAASLPHLPSTPAPGVNPRRLWIAHTKGAFASTHGPPVAMSVLIMSPKASPTMPPTGTATVSPGMIVLQVRLPATIVVGFRGLALMSASKLTPNVRAMIAGLSPVLTW
jgi:hypothetical protein